MLKDTMSAIFRSTSLKSCRGESLTTGLEKTCRVRANRGSLTLGISEVPLETGESQDTADDTCVVCKQE